MAIETQPQADLDWLIEVEPSVFNYGEAIHRTSRFQELGQHWVARDWEAFRSLAEREFRNEASPCKKSFWLFALVASCETQYDLALREKYINEWMTFPARMDSQYSKHIYHYLNGNSAFFSGHLHEAEVSFQAAHAEAESLGYVRGETRSLFHLGLVTRDRGLLYRARSLLELAKQKAQKIPWQRYVDRSDEQIQLLMSDNNGTTVSTETDALMDLVRHRKFKEARRAYLSMRRFDRHAGLNYGSRSLNTLLPLILLGFNHEALACQAEAWIRDPVLRFNYFTLKKIMFSLSPSETFEMEMLHQKIGRSSVQTSTRDSSDIAVAGISLRSLRAPELEKAVKLLLANPSGIDKETFFNGLWHEGYDPVIHDPKIYKLVLRLRRIFGSDFILNSYGSYKLNPKLLGYNRVS